jgi:hypothetical protein
LQQRSGDRDPAAAAAIAEALGDLPLALEQAGAARTARAGRWPATSVVCTLTRRCCSGVAAPADYE